MKKRAAFFVVLFVLCLSVSAQAIELGAGVLYWFPEFTGDLRADTEIVRGTKIDLQDDLGIGDESYPSIQVFAGMGDHHLGVTYTYVDYSGDEKISKEIWYGGTKFVAASRVKTDLEYHMLDLEYRYDLIDFENILAGFSLGPLARVKWLTGDARLESFLGEQEDTFNVLVPMVGAGFHVGIIADMLEARAELAGLGYMGNKFYEGLADISFTPIPLINIHGGYKLIRLDVEDVNDIYANFEFSGPYIGLDFKL